MPVLDSSESDIGKLAPGVQRVELVNGTLGATSLTVADLSVGPRATVPTHTHPTEEAMVIIEGELDAIIGDEVVPVTPGRTVLAPSGVRHGFVNRSETTARIMAVFPTSKVERTLVE